jgi:hypothetical protein
MKKATIERSPPDPTKASEQADTRGLSNGDQLRIVARRPLIDALVALSAPY